MGGIEDSEGRSRESARGRKNEKKLSIFTFLARFLVFSPSKQCHIDCCGPQ